MVPPQHAAAMQYQQQMAAAMAGHMRPPMDPMQQQAMGMPGFGAAAAQQQQVPAHLAWQVQQQAALQWQYQQQVQQHQQLQQQGGVPGYPGVTSPRSAAGAPAGAPAWGVQPGGYGMPGAPVGGYGMPGQMYMAGQMPSGGAGQAYGMGQVRAQQKWREEYAGHMLCWVLGVWVVF